MTEHTMTTRADLVRRADELRQQAKTESDQPIRDRLVRMAEHYTHLADSQTQSDAHAPNVASLGEMLTRRD
jgi:hypothetical protein